MAFGFLLGSIITGVFTWKVVVPKVMENKDMKDLKDSLKRAISLFERAIPLLEKILEQALENHSSPQNEKVQHDKKQG